MRVSIVRGALASILLVFTTTASGTAYLQNGGMEDPFSNNLATPWTFYYGGTVSGRTQSKETTNVHGGSSSQKLAGSAGSAAGNMGIQQTIDANIGDAFTFGGWVWPDAAGTYQETSIRVAWDGGTSAGTAAALSSWLPSGTTRRLWHEMPLAGGNATSTSVTVFLHSKRTGANGSLLTYWDDVVGYHAFVPAAPSASNLTASTADIDVNPGDNGASAEYAMTITGGAYGEAEGVYWINAAGSVSTTKAFMTDAGWAVKTLTGLGDGTYTVKALARYSSTIQQETYLGNPVSFHIPEPTTVALLGLGSLLMLRRRQRA